MATQEDFSDDLNTPTEEDLEKCYGSRFLGAVDIGTKKIKTRILKISKDKMQQQGGPERIKFVLFLANIDKPMVLNATNKNVLVDKLGRNPVDWKGAEIGLFTMDTQFGGRPTKGLRLVVISKPKAAKPVKAAVAKPAEEPWPDEEGDPGFGEAAGTSGLHQQRCSPFFRKQYVPWTISRSCPNTNRPGCSWVALHCAVRSCLQLAIGRCR